MNRWLSEWGGCLGVCVTSLKFAYASTAPICLYDAAIMSLLTHFRSESLPVEQICQSNWRKRINIISVESGLSFSPVLLSGLSHLGHEWLLSRLEHSRNGPIESLRSYDRIHVLGYSVDISLVCGLFLGGNVCVRVCVRACVHVYITLARSNQTGMIFFPQDSQQLPHDWT